MSGSPLVEIAYEKIRHRLLNADYSPGVLLSESGLAAELNMSRTPVRDAIRLLEKEGFVQTLTKRGIRVNTIEINELFDMFDLLTALYLFTLDIVEQYHDEIDLERMRAYLDKVIEASENKRYREYYENGLLFMRTLLETIHNRHILQTFDMYKDKILFFVVAHRSYKNPNRPYTGKKAYSEIYRYLSEGDIRGAKKEILNSKWHVRDELVRSGQV
jgi:DNA-binding GntR family transcriptional regulator